MKRLKLEDFINKCKEKHDNRYDYSCVDYINISTKIKIICKEHGEFNQIAKNHKDGQGCPSCYGDLNISKFDFIKKYGREEYDYSLIEEPLRIKGSIKIMDKRTGLTYIQLADHHKRNIKPSKIESNSLVKKLKQIHNDGFNYLIEKETYYSTDKIKIINKKTKDEFYYRVDRHLSGMKPNKVTLNYFLIKSKEIHGDKYDYSLIKSIKGSSNKKVEIICKDHGLFTQRISNHMNLGDGCPKCVGVGKWNTELLISEFKKVHSDKFDYSNVKFENVDKKVEIICKEHGRFRQGIHKHLSGQGCRFCESSSKGEDYVKMWLDEMNLNYNRQHSFDTCRYVNKLSFDFYLPDHNICIEFDGKQHFKSIDWFGGDKEFIKNKERDKVKDDWCVNNNVGLLRIKYNQVNKIKYILQEKLQIVDKK